MQSVSSTLLKSRSIHQTKAIVLSPLSNGILQSFTATNDQQIAQFTAVRDPSISKLLIQLYHIFRHLRDQSISACIELILSTLALVGSLIKAQDSSSSDGSSPSPLSIPALTGTLQALSTLARRLFKSATTNSISLGSPQTLLDAFRIEYAHMRRDAKNDIEKKTAMVVVLIEMIKICVVDLSNPNIIESILASTQGILDTDDDHSTLPKSISATYHFYLSKHHLFLDNFDQSRTELQSALKQLISSMTNTNRVLFHLIPLQLVRGIFPSKNWLKNSHPVVFQTYYPIIRAIRSRNLEKLHDLLDEQVVLKQTFFFLLKHLDLLVFRLILKDIVFLNGGKKQVSFSLFEDIVGPTISSSEILAILIQQGMINGYITYEENVLVLTGSNPFPPGPWVINI